MGRHARAYIYAHRTHRVNELIYYSAWADQGRRMRSYTPRGGDRREYIGESRVYIQFTTAAQRNGFGLVNSPQSSLGEPLPALQSPRTVLTASTTAHTNFPGYSWSYTVLTWWVEPRTGGQTRYCFPACS